jgi:hypothetical protein
MKQRRKHCVSKRRGIEARLRVKQQEKLTVNSEWLIVLMRILAFAGVRISVFTRRGGFTSD